MSWIIALVGGALAGWFSPWVKYILELRKDRYKHRRDLVGQWREGLAIMNRGDPYYSFKMDPRLQSLSPHFTEGENFQIGQWWQEYVAANKRNVQQVARLKEMELTALVQTVIDRSEKKWRLV